MLSNTIVLDKISGIKTGRWLLVERSITFRLRSVFSNKAESIHFIRFTVGTPKLQSDFLVPDPLVTDLRPCNQQPFPTGPFRHQARADSFRHHPLPNRPPTDYPPLRGPLQLSMSCVTERQSSEAPTRPEKPVLRRHLLSFPLPEVPCPPELQSVRRPRPRHLDQSTTIPLDQHPTQSALGDYGFVPPRWEFPILRKPLSLRIVRFKWVESALRISGKTLSNVLEWRE